MYSVQKFYFRYFDHYFRNFAHFEALRTVAFTEKDAPYQSSTFDFEDTAKWKTGAGCSCEPSRVGSSYEVAKQSFITTAAAAATIIAVSPVAFCDPVSKFMAS